MERKLLIDEVTIQKRILQLADEINRDYKGKELTIICILKGSMYFCSDLSRRIDCPTEIEFMRLSSYKGKNSTGKVDVKVGLDHSIKGKDVLVVEDIIDSGRTLSFLLEYLKLDEPNSIRLCTLLDKPSRREPGIDIKVDYVGFTIRDRFVVGYGLDLDEEYRNLPEIQCFTKDSDKVVQKEADDIRNQLIKTKLKK